MKLQHAVLAIALLSACESGPRVPPATSSLADTVASSTLSPVADSYVNDGSLANANFGLATPLLVKTNNTVGLNRDAYLKFDLSNVAAVQQATLTVAAHTNDGTAVPFAVYAVSDVGWQEQILTFNNRPAFGAALTPSQTVVGTSDVALAFDVSTYVAQQKAAGANLIAFAFHAENNNGTRIEIVSREGSVSSRPVLTVTSAAAGAIHPVADSYVNDGALAATNFGSTSPLLVKTSSLSGYNRDAYFKFDLSSVTNPSAAIFSVYAHTNDGTAVPFQAFGVTDSTWQEDTINFTNRPPLGGAISPVLTANGVVDHLYAFDVSAYVLQQKAAGITVVTLALHAQNNIGTRIEVVSREGDSAHQPTLDFGLAPPPPPPPTFAALAATAESTLEQTFYGSGQWNLCLPAGSCGATNVDWGADALTYALYLRWLTANSPTTVSILAALDSTGPTWGSCYLATCGDWSDVPQWDSVAAMREYQATGRASALARAKAAFAFVDASDAFALGACPSISYQQPGGSQNHLKTLETDSNYVKAAVLLFEATHEQTYLNKAIAKYASIRQYFLDQTLPLYSVYVFDQDGACTQVQGRFFASVNGNMIFNGLHLSSATNDPTYSTQAQATALAVTQKLSDASGVFVDLQAENDVVEPLVEAMFELAQKGQSFAGDWLITNAKAAAYERNQQGGYGRFFNGPSPATTVTAWQSNGGFALAFVAAALDPNEQPPVDSFWASAAFTNNDISILPATITFTGEAIALRGTIGEQCCESGHARVFIDNVETVDTTGIWQNKSSSGQSLPNSILFAWRWPTAGTHTLQFQPGVPNGKEGSSFLHLNGYYVVP